MIIKSAKSLVPKPFIVITEPVLVKLVVADLISVLSTGELK